MFLRRKRFFFGYKERILTGFWHLWHQARVNSFNSYTPIFDLMRRNTNRNLMDAHPSDDVIKQVKLRVL